MKTLREYIDKLEEIDHGVKEGWFSSSPEEKLAKEDKRVNAVIKAVDKMFYELETNNKFDLDVWADEIRDPDSLPASIELQIKSSDIVKAIDNEWNHWPKGFWTPQSNTDLERSKRVLLLFTELKKQIIQAWNQAKSGVVEETSPDAISKIDDLFK